MYMPVSYEQISTARVRSTLTWGSQKQEKAFLLWPWPVPPPSCSRPALK